MLILISSFLLVAFRGFLLAYSFTGSTATSRAGSQGIGVNGTHPSTACSSSGIAAHVVVKHEEAYISTTLKPPTPVDMNTTSHHK
jgi:hypothetical protein